MFEGLKKKCSYQPQVLNELCVWCTFGYCGGVRFNHTKYFSVLIMMLLVDQIPCCHQFIGMHLNHHLNPDYLLFGKTWNQQYRNKQRICKTYQAIL